MALKLITPPVDMIVTLDEAKAHLRILDDNEDDLITLLIKAVTRFIDGDTWIQRAWKPQTWRLSYDAWPEGPIEIPLSPLISVESVKYIDEEGDLVTIDSDNYVVDTQSTPGWVARVESYDWPTPMAVINNVQVEFIAGYEDTNDSPPGNGVPEDIRLAVLQMVADTYEQRETFVTGTIVTHVPMSPTVENILHQYRVFR